jgi:hypothetical protein
VELAFPYEVGRDENTLFPCVLNEVENFIVVKPKGIEEEGNGLKVLWWFNI